MDSVGLGLLCMSSGSGMALSWLRVDQYNAVEAPRTQEAFSAGPARLNCRQQPGSDRAEEATTTKSLPLLQSFKKLLSCNG